MFFNSTAFAVFMPIVFCFYWFVFNRNLRLQNLFLIIVSYIFYAWWDYRFLFLLIFSTSLDYFTGLKIFEARTKIHKKTWMLISICINLGFLGFFKYYNFFIESFAEFLSAFGFQAHLWTLKIILPVGISFYTFHGLSYVIDIYKGKITPTRNVVDYSLFVSFFPLLVAGPIERATHLLPQLQKPRTFAYAKAVDGLRQILWGLFKKMVIADNCATIVNDVFSNYNNYSGSTLALSAVFFAFQIYCDFSGYSDIALGSARLLGVELLKNFAFPYFSRDIAEFWRRWHISLTTWFRDYLYIPLGGSKTSKMKIIRNTFIIFIVSGFWHGSNWTFIAWGAYHALLFLPLILLGKNRRYTNIVAEKKYFLNIKEIFQVGITFGLVVFGWIFFRAENMTHAWNYISKIFSDSLFTVPKLARTFVGGFPNRMFALVQLLPIIVFVFAEWLNRNKEHGLQIDNIKSPIIRWAIYFIIIVITWACSGQQETFIYFQF